MSLSTAVNSVCSWHPFSQNILMRAPGFVCQHRCLCFKVPTPLPPHPVPCLPLSIPNFSFVVMSSCPSIQSSSAASRSLTLKSCIPDLLPPPVSAVFTGLLPHCPALLFSTSSNTSQSREEPRGARLFCRSHGAGWMSNHVEEKERCSEFQGTVSEMVPQGLHVFLSSSAFMLTCLDEVG